MHLNSFEVGVDVPEAFCDKRHRRHRQPRSGEGKAYTKPSLKQKVSANMELAEDSVGTTTYRITKPVQGEVLVESPVESTGLDVEKENWPSLNGYAGSEDAKLVAPAKSYAALLPESKTEAQQWQTVKKSSGLPKPKEPSPTEVKVVLQEKVPEDPESEADEAGDFRPRGWSKGQKSSKSAAAQRKVAYQSARRAEQRRQCKDASTASSEEA